MTLRVRLRPLVPSAAVLAMLLAPVAQAQTPALDPAKVTPANPVPTTSYRVASAPPPAPMPPLRRAQAERLLAELDAAPAHGFSA